MDANNDLYNIKKVLEGDTAAFSGILQRYSNRIFAVIVRIVGCREDAEELTQDVFMKVFSSLKQYKGNSEFSTWIYRIAYNTAMSYTRKQRKEIPYIDESLYENISEEEVDALFNRTDNSEKIEQLEQSVARLTGEEKALLSLFYTDMRPINEIAKITGLTETNVKTKLHRIRKKLYIIMSEIPA
ncbi:MAG: RNA polymerase sigma factor [Bacteroidaceae bacterium]|nr:RNA polymerase sigma factor [Bacteroidaceae bacterium]